MNPCEFEERMQQILQKLEQASDMSFDWRVVSGDPDCVADFGCDHEGYLVIDETSFPLKLEDLTGIRYRWNNETDSSDCFVRFDFGKNIYIDYCVDRYTTDCYHVKYHNRRKICLTEKQAIELIEGCLREDTSTDESTVSP